MSPCGRVLALLAALVLVLQAGPETYALDVEELIAHVEQTEKALGGMTASFRRSHEKSGGVIFEGEWGREDGKEYVRGWQYTKDPEGGLKRDYEEIRAFDGEEYRTYWPAEMQGTCEELENHLDAHAAPARLLGYSLAADARTLGALFRSAKNTEIVSTDSLVEGRLCVELNCDVPGYVLRPVSAVKRTSAYRPPRVDITDSGFRLAAALAETERVPVTQSVKVWFDAERDWRIVQIRWYRDASRQEQGFALEKVQLERFGEHYLPVSGVTLSYHTEPVPLDGYTIEQLKTMPEEEAVKHLRFERVVTGGEGYLITAWNWETGKDIDDSLFTIKFPVGSDVWDAFNRVRLHMWEGDVSP